MTDKDMIKDLQKRTHNVYILIHEAILDYNRYFNNQQRLNALLDAFKVFTNYQYSILFEFENNHDRPFDRQRIITERIMFNDVEVSSHNVELED